jgi:Prokaryotic E2 family E
MASDGQRLLVVPGVPTNAHWNIPTVTIRVVIPAGYPHVTLDCFYTDATLRLASGAEPGNKFTPGRLRRSIPLVLVARPELDSEHGDCGPLHTCLRGTLPGGPVTVTLEPLETLWRATRDDLLSTPEVERRRSGSQARAGRMPGVLAGSRMPDVNGIVAAREVHA